MIINLSPRYIFRSGIQKLYLQSLKSRYRQFEFAVRHPKIIQENRLKAILKANQNTQYGRQCNFASISCVKNYRDQVPIVDYDAIEKHIQSCAAGEKNILCAENIKLMELSGGSSGPEKLIPYTKGLLQEFSSAIDPWLFDLHQSNPELKGTRSYWAISPIQRTTRVTSGGISIGIDNDLEYFGPLTRIVLNEFMLSSREIGECKDIERWRFETAKLLLACKDLGMISVWSPTFLLLILEYIEREAHRLIPTSARFCPGNLSQFWPRLKLISCWTDASSALFIPRLRQWFPEITIQSKGLLSVEGIISIPLSGIDGPVLAVGGHFLEFIDLENPDSQPRQAFELEVGGHYSPLLTTSGGLYRYNLKDSVQCLGYYHSTPIIRFEGKIDSTSDLCGEKLNPIQVETALRRVTQAMNLSYEFALMAPSLSSGETPFYLLFLEAAMTASQIEVLSKNFDLELRRGHPYDYARQLGQLGQVQIRSVKNALSFYLSSLEKSGLRAGTIKHNILDKRLNWAQLFTEHARVS
ncbi:MAG: hypothetical protein A2X86_17145 [Bdellovibrionales bacterium GWA2_49_15]|nr:MAG: hypothetical protein A2X86_17145 [Bdellovibrionales bacterium GWA2_49_15]HAZ14035.1 hypothetical protein [Bdellovibrionales bacterium]